MITCIAAFALCNVRCRRDHLRRDHTIDTDNFVEVRLHGGIGDICTSNKRIMVQIPFFVVSDPSGRSTSCSRSSQNGSSSGFVHVSHAAKPRQSFAVTGSPSRSAWQVMQTRGTFIMGEEIGDRR